LKTNNARLNALWEIATLSRVLVSNATRVSLQLPMDPVCQLKTAVLGAQVVIALLVSALLAQVYTLCLPWESVRHYKLATPVMGLIAMG